MTRENKLALVIGFGLLLLAGILVSDHLSAQQRVEEDSLVAAEPRVVPDPSILQPKNAPAAATLQPTETPAPGAPQPPRRREIVIGKAPGAPSGATPPSRVSSKPRVHFVKPGETLTEISTIYFKTPDHWQAIAQSNNIADPNRLPVGTRLVIGTLPEAAPAPSTRAGGDMVAPARSRARTTTVLEGDTLSGIAKRELGSAKKWHDLWQANKSILPNPDRLAPGMTLQLPVSSSTR